MRLRTSDVLAQGKSTTFGWLISGIFALGRMAAAAGQAPAGPVDPPGLRDQVLQLFGEWCMLVEEQPAEKAHRDFVARLQQAGFLKVLPCPLPPLLHSSMPKLAQASQQPLTTKPASDLTDHHTCNCMGAELLVASLHDSLRSGLDLRSQTSLFHFIAQASRQGPQWV